MKKYISDFNMLVAFSLLISILIIPASYAHNHNEKSMADKVEIEGAWARATFALAKTGAAYFNMTNNSAESVHLKSASVSGDVAMMTEIHHTIMKNDMMQMQELEEGVMIDANQTVSFEPGGKHIMLMGLSGPLNKGESVEITFTFADDSSLTHTFNILDKRNNKGHMNH